MSETGAESLRGVPVGRRRRALFVALWLALALLLGGVDLPARGYGFLRFQWFGIVSALLGVLYLYVLVDRDVIRRVAGWQGGLLAAYWIAATATVFAVLLPPHGVAHVVFAVATACVAAVIVTRSNRSRATGWLVVLVSWLAVVRFGLIPLFKVRGVAAEKAFPWLSELGPALRGLSATYPTDRSAELLLDVLAVACWSAALLAQRRPVDALGAPSER
jgi:hypothetical protein